MVLLESLLQLYWNFDWLDLTLVIADTTSIMGLFCQKAWSPSSLPTDSSSYTLSMPSSVTFPSPGGKGEYDQSLFAGENTESLKWLKEPKADAGVRIQSRVWYQSSSSSAAAGPHWGGARESLCAQWLTSAPFVSDLLMNGCNDAAALGCSESGLRNPQVSFGPGLTRPLHRSFHLLAWGSQNRVPLGSLFQGYEFFSFINHQF